MHFLIEDDSLLKDAMSFWITSALMIKNNLIANLPTITKFLKTKIKSYCDEFTDFCDKETTKVDSNHTCLTPFLKD